MGKEMVAVNFTGQREGLKCAVENLERIGDAEAIVGDGDSGLFCTQDAAQDGSAVPGAGATMDDELEAGEVFGEIAPMGPLEMELTAYVAIEHTGNFNGPDIFMDGMMGAGFGDEHFIAGLEAVNGERTAGHFIKVALEASEKDGKTGQRDIGRGEFIDGFESLRIGNDDGRFLIEFAQGLRELGFAADDDKAAGVEQIADGLDFGQNEASLGSGFINWGDENGASAFRDQVRSDRGTVNKFIGDAEDERLEEFIDAPAGFGGENNGGCFCLPIEAFNQSGRRLREIGFIEHDDGGDILSREFFQKRILKIGPFTRFDN